MNGKDYVAVVALRNKAGVVLVKPGEICEPIPASSLTWLLSGGHIALASGSVAVEESPGDAAAETPKARRPRKAGGE